MKCQFFINRDVGELPIALYSSKFSLSFDGFGLLFVSACQPVINGEKNFISLQSGMKMNLSFDNMMIFLFYPFDKKALVTIEYYEDYNRCISISADQKKHRWKTIDKLRIAKEYSTTSVSANIITEKYSISLSTLTKWCQAFGLKKDRKLYAKRGRCYTDEMILDIVNEFVSGTLSAASVADKYYIDIRTLFSWCKSTGLKKPKKQIKSVVVRLVYQDLVHGVSNKSIQTKYGFSDRTLMYYLKSAKLLKRKDLYDELVS